MSPDQSRLPAQNHPASIPNRPHPRPPNPRWGPAPLGLSVPPVQAAPGRAAPSSLVGSDRDRRGQSLSDRYEQLLSNQNIFIHHHKPVCVCLDRKSIHCFIDVCFSDDSAEAPAGNSSAKGPLPAPRLKRAPSEQERESTSSNPAGPLSPQDGWYLCLTSVDKLLVVPGVW